MTRVQYNTRTNEEQNADRFRWLTTFNDMITLLMVFFVLLFAMGSMDMKRFKTFQNALQSAMGVLNSGKNAPVGVIAAHDDNASEPGKAQNGIEKDGDNLEQLNHTEGLEAEYTRKGIQLILNDNLLFNSGSAEITLRGRQLLNKVVNVIAPINRMVRVEGHTDNIPISTDRFPSNWELSAARAVNVIRYIQGSGKIPARNLSAAGYGASKPRAKNDSETDRTRNRRVEIILKNEATLY